jgi:hypothetical protein
MGYYTIINPSTGEQLNVQKIGLHYMEHGSFTYDGSYNDGRVDVVALAGILQDPHLITIPGDTDADHLTDGEEASIGYDAANPDENGNWITDGADLARQMSEVIRALPVGPLPDQLYLIEYPQYGIEICAICGEDVNMGYVEIHNPMTGTSFQLPYIALHAMEHESFSYDGTYHQDGRIDLVALKEVLEGK